MHRSAGMGDHDLWGKRADLHRCDSARHGADVGGAGRGGHGLQLLGGATGAGGAGTGAAPLDGQTHHFQAQRRAAQPGHRGLRHDGGGICRRMQQGAGMRRHDFRRLLRHHAGLHCRIGPLAGWRRRGGPPPGREAQRHLLGHQSGGNGRGTRHRRAHQPHREKDAAASAAPGRHGRGGIPGHSPAGRRGGDSGRERGPAGAGRGGDDGPGRPRRAGGKRFAGAD